MMDKKSPRITVDGLIVKNKTILLVERKYPPYEGKWALPGGFVEYKETVEDAVIRELFEETSLKTKIEYLLGVYSKPDRDPRGHTISVVYKLNIVNGDLKSGDDAKDAKFFDFDRLPELAFDHADIISDYLKRSK